MSCENLYLHIPFCAKKCHYCAFYSVVSTPSDIAAYPELIAHEAASRLGDTMRSPRTVYFGGGTPGMLGADGISALTKNFARLGIHFADAEEWTVELNPASVTQELLRTLRECGVTRLSFGAQSFSDDTLRRIGRAHSAEQTLCAIAAARKLAFDNIGIDIIAGLPGENSDQWHDILTKTVATKPEHISVYPLILEPGTELARDVAAARIMLPESDRIMDELAKTEDFLAAEGFNRYEISNYARENRQCRHNLACWRGEDYIGLGPAAASRTGRSRRINAPSILRYRYAVEKGELPPAEHEETLSELDDAVERSIFSLRLSEDFCPADLAQKYPILTKCAPQWEKILAALEKNGITRQTAVAKWQLTPRGREVADAIAADMMPDNDI